MLAIREHRFPFLNKVGDWNRFGAAAPAAPSSRNAATSSTSCASSSPTSRCASLHRAAPDVNHKDERYDGAVPDILDNAYVIVDFRSGARAMLDLCMFAEGSYWQEIVAATGERARVECFVPGPARFRPGHAERHAEIEISPREPRGPVRRKVPVDEAILKAGEHHGSTFYQHQKFRAAVLDGAPVEVTMEDGLRAVAIGLAAELSVKEKRAVAIDGLKFRVKVPPFASPRSRRGLPRQQAREAGEGEGAVTRRRCVDADWWYARTRRDGSGCRERR